VFDDHSSYRDDASSEWVQNRETLQDKDDMYDTYWHGVISSDRWMCFILMCQLQGHGLASIVLFT
jgi:hypothetical protein